MPVLGHITRGTGVPRGLTTRCCCRSGSRGYQADAKPAADDQTPEGYHLAFNEPA